MAVAFVGASTPVVGNNASVSPTVPTGAASGDFLLLVWSSRGTGVAATPAGWTPFSGNPIQNTSSPGFNNVYLFYKYPSATTEAAPAVAVSGGGSNQVNIATILRFSGVHASAPLPASSIRGGAFSVIPFNAYTPTSSANALLAIGHVADDSASPTAIPVGTGSGLATWNVGTGLSTTTGSDATLDISYALGPASTDGTESQGVSTTAPAGAACVGALVELAPVPAPATPSDVIMRPAWRADHLLRR